MTRARMVCTDIHAQLGYMYMCLDSDDPSYKICNQILTHVQLLA